ncbi:DUF1254 domain-containing protein [Actinospica sp. MGRD01-02]|uniref:DUF1254 domain-containing protein n=1 Tax=Actinospica acidithermotolerans TaxID=2828514 RepID=A0A941EJL1_9ACTN|nr:DUF1254 domain-containing protein [Actinospica acidithermotolerans]MBR7828799.1 DUF1254 domain-containing protein [Actinospica acidithermotolerans]
MGSADLRTLGREAYVYLYPLVMMEVTREQAAAPRPGVKPGYGPANQFHHLRAFPAADFRAVVRPNFDTLYSNAWLDLTAGPVLLHVTATADRYFMLPLMDMWTDVFATIGTRTTGNGDQDFLVVGPGHPGDRPAAVPSTARLLRAPTPHVWIIGRTQTNGPADYDAVHSVQDGYALTELVPVEHAPDPTVDVATDALRIVNGLSAPDFFTRAARALAVNPPHAADFSILARIARLGLVPGRAFDPGRLDAAQLAEIQDGVDAARSAIMGSLTGFGTPANGWRTSTDTMGTYGNNYFKRAAVAAGGLGANPPEDAIYPILALDADGEPLTGECDYVLRFDAGQLPPAEAFWSVTMYDAEGFQAANELNRFALGDRDPLTYDSDGSLEIYLSHTNPGPRRQANWLPAPLGPLGVTMRLYSPRPEALDGRWNPPPVRKARP